MNKHPKTKFISKVSTKGSFLVFFNKRIQYLKECNRHGTAINYQRAKTSLEKFLKGEELPFKKLDVKFIDNYSEWLFKQGMVRNSVSFHLRILRAVYNTGVRKGIIKQSYPFREVYTGIDKTRKRCINASIIKSLISLKLDSGSPLFLARDMFLFSLYTRGMSFVDLSYLKKSNLTGEELIYVRKKSKSIIKIRIEKEIKDIINRYLKLYPSSPYLFPILRETSQTECHTLYLKALSLYNYRLKKLAKMIGVSCSLSSYTSRHTWASLIYKMNVPVSIISAGLGHSSEQVTRIYLDSLDNSAIDKANREFITNILS